MLTFDIDLDLIFGVAHRAIDVKVNIEDNQVPEASKKSDYSTLTNKENETISSSNSRVSVEQIQNSTNVQVEGEHLISSSHNNRQDLNVDGKHMTIQVDVKREHMSTQADVEGGI